MSKLTLAGVLVGLGTICLSAVKLAAGGPDESGVISFKGNVNSAWATRPSIVFRAGDPNPANLVVVFSNFGKKSHLYEHTVAWDVAGPTQVCSSSG
jgi:hypothetical protein